MSIKDETNESVLVQQMKDVSLKVLGPHALCECEYGHQKNPSDRHGVSFEYTVK